MALKGQKIRLFLDGKCIALCKTSSIHVVAQLEDVSTKDSDGDFAENEIVGLSWEASATAYVEPKTEAKYLTYSEFKQPPVSSPGSMYWYYPVPVHLKKGDTVKGVGENTIARIFDTEFNTLATSASSLTKAVYTAPVDIIVYFGLTYYSSGSALYHTEIIRESALTYEDILSAITNKTMFDFELDNTGGGSNRVIETGIVQGECIVTDVQCTAENRKRGVYTLQLTGVGELGIVEPEPDNDEEENNEPENLEIG